MEVLEEEPGLHKRGLRDRLSVAPQVFEHHLGKLEDAGEVLIREGVETNQTVCFTRDQAHLWADKATRILWGRHRTRQVAAVLVDRAPATTPDLTEALDLTATGVRHHLRKLRARGLVEMDRKGLRVHYLPSPKLEIWVEDHRETIRDPHGSDDA